MLFAIHVLIAADGIVAFAAVGAGGFAYQPCMDQLHGLKIRIAERGHNFQEIVLFCKFRCGALCELIINGLAFFKRRHGHLKVAPFVALLFGS